MEHTRVVIAGASGLIGQALTNSLRADGVQVLRLVRHPAKSTDEIEWLTHDSPLDPAVLVGAQAVINLNGASIAKMPWTSAYRKTLISSRLEPTHALARALRSLGSDAPHFLSASAVGYYGNRPGEQLTESSGAGSSFLAQLCADWERAALEAGDGARTALLRTAPLLHRNAVLKPLITLTRFGLSGPLGSGEQYWPWISLEDEIRAIRHIIDNELSGPLNLTGPAPATANDIGRALAKAMHRPFLIPAPAWALRLGLGRQAADSLLLADAQLRPDALQTSGFTFLDGTASQAIATALSS